MAAATRTKDKIDVDSLDPAARRKLLEQLQAAQAEEIDAEAAARNAAFAALLEGRDHARGCPPDGRVEVYAHVRPAQPAKGREAEPVTVVRCIECGGSTVINKPVEEVLEDLD